MLAEPEGTPRGAIVVIQEIFGVNPGIRAKCDHWASLGYLGIAPDLFWRIRSRRRARSRRARAISGGARPDAEARSGQGDRGYRGDCIREARSRLPDGGKVGAVGYCLGGRLAFMTAARTDVDASVGYYGVGLEGLMGEKHAIARPLLLHIAGADHFVTPDKQALIHEGLDDHPRVTLHDYPGEDHGFATEIGQSPERTCRAAGRQPHRGLLRRASRLSGRRPQGASFTASSGQRNLSTPTSWSTKPS